MAFSSASKLSLRPAVRTAGQGLLALAGAGVVVYLLLAGHGRVAVTLMLTGLFLATAKLDVRLAIPLVFVYLIFLGDLRRLLIPYFGWSGTDPLLLVGGVFAILVTTHALAKGAIPFDTKLAKWAAALVAIMALQIFNPQQGGLMVGIAGGLFMLVPIFWFWVGRTYATPALMETLLYKIVLPMSVVAAAIGTYQVYFGYLPHQQLWLEMNYYAGLGDPSNPAPLSLFASNTEYGGFVGIGIVLAWAAFLRGHRSAALLIPPLLIAVALTGSRGPVFFPIVMMAGLWAVLAREKKTWLLRGALALVLAAVGLTWSLTQATTQGGMDSHVQSRLNRQAELFAPGTVEKDDDYNSATNHFSMMMGGYTFALKEPLGLGLGAVTKAAGKFGGRGHSTETPFGNSFVALGLPGGIAYHVVVFFVVLAAFRYWLRTRSRLALALLGVLGVTMTNLLAGGMYAVGPITAFCAGAVGRLERHSQEAA